MLIIAHDFQYLVVLISPITLLPLASFICIAIFRKKNIRLWQTICLLFYYAATLISFCVLVSRCPVPSWSGRLYTSCIVASPFLFILYVSILLKSRTTSDVPKCKVCGYNLFSNVSGVCPECGTAIASDH